MMGGASLDDDWELTSSTNEVQTLVLVGRTGNGKSATGNSIIGKEVFNSKHSSSGVTSSCERHTTTLKDGQTVNVIDTPGLFDISAECQFDGKEIANCINLAKDGIHAVIVVFSVHTRFSKEEETALRSLQTLFGEQISDYLIVVFTGGDALEKRKQTLKDYLGNSCPEPLKDILTLCKNRCVLFNNDTEDEMKQSEQVQQLSSFVNDILSQNDGQPYTDELFAKLKKGAMELHNQQSQVNSLEGRSNKEILEYKKQAKQAYDDMLKQIAEMVESKLREATVRFEQQLKEEQTARRKAVEKANKEICELRKQHAARLKAEENANKEIRELREQQAARLEAEKNANKEIRKLREQLRKAQENENKAREELRKQGGGSCVIL